MEEKTITDSIKRYSYVAQIVKQKSEEAKAMYELNQMLELEQKQEQEQEQAQMQEETNAQVQKSTEINESEMVFNKKRYS